MVGRRNEGEAEVSRTTASLRRFLQALEKGVGGLHVHPLGIDHDGHPPPRFPGLSREPAPQGPHVLHIDRPAHALAFLLLLVDAIVAVGDEFLVDPEDVFAAEDHEIGVGVGGRPPAMRTAFAGAAIRVVAHQGSGQGLGQSPLPHPGKTVNENGVMQTPLGHRSPESFACVFMAQDAGKRRAHRRPSHRLLTRDAI